MLINQTNQTEQFQLAEALAELFHGKNIRYWVKGDETWFVAKDVVEAAGGQWHAPTFIKSVDGEGVNASPIPDSLGRTQEITIANQQTIITWLVRSRLPETGKLAKLVWGIIGKVLKGEKINTGAERALQSNREKAIHHLQAEWTPIQAMLKGLGYSDGAIQAEFLENAVMCEAKYNETILSDNLKQQLIAGQSILTDKSLPAQARITSAGGTGVKATTLALKLGVKPKEVNDAFEALGWAKRAEGGVMLPLSPGRKFCYVKEVTRGKFLGSEVIETWNESLVWNHLTSYFKK